MADQVIYDRGYRTYDGPRLGPKGARRAVYKDGVRRVLGLGRKARRRSSLGRSSSSPSSLPPFSSASIGRSATSRKASVRRSPPTAASSTSTRHLPAFHRPGRPTTPHPRPDQRSPLRLLLPPVDS